MTQAEFIQGICVLPLEAGLLTLDWNILAVGGCPGNCRMFSNMLALTPSDVVTAKNDSRRCPLRPGGRDSMQSKTTELTSCLQIVGCPGACSALSIIKAMSSCWGKNGAKAQGLLSNSCAQPL